MKNVLAAVVVLCGCITVDAQEAGRVFPYSYEAVELPNGFRAYLVKAPTPGQIAVISFARVGSRDEVDPGKSGFAHFFEHMMFSGTRKYPDYDGETTRMGAFRNATTGPDRTEYYMVANSDYLEKIIDIDSDRFQNLTYDEPRFKTEAGAVLGEQQQGALDPERWLYERVRAAIFDKHPYRHPTIGTEADVRAMPQAYDYSKTFFDRFYRPENVVLVIAGDFDTGKARELVRRHYAGWKPGYKPPQIVPEPAQTAPREVTVRYPGRTLPILTVNYRAPAWNPSDRSGAALTVLGELAFGTNSALYRKLVLQERRVQALAPAFTLARDPYIVTVQATVSNPAETKAVESEILATIRAFQATLADAKHLAATKSNIRYSFVMGLETAQQIASAARQSIVSTGRLEPLEEYYATIAAVTPEDVRNAARTYLVDSGRTIVTMVQEN
jgi:zinc protease